MRLWPSISRCFFIAIADLHLAPRSSHTFWVNIIPYVPLLAKSFPRLFHQLHSRIRDPTTVLTHACLMGRMMQWGKLSAVGQRAGRKEGLGG